MINITGRVMTLGRWADVCLRHFMFMKAKIRCQWRAIPMLHLCSFVPPRLNSFICETDY